MESLKGRRENGWGKEEILERKILEEIMTDIFPNWAKNLKEPQAQERRKKTTPSLHNQIAQNQW